MGNDPVDPTDEGYLDITTQVRLDNNFRYHPPSPDQVPRYEALREGGKTFATLIARFCPPSPERSTALRMVEEAVMNANAAIARHEDGA